MKANELRVGNWVKFEGNFYQIHSINDNDRTVELGDGYYYLPSRYNIRYIKPIKLTEQWLINANMKLVGKFSNQRYLRVKKHKFDISQITFSPVERLVRLESGYKESILIPHIKYVHQLQNLYFALMGKELKIKANPCKR
jgi:hypothetical protein